MSRKENSIMKKFRAIHNKLLVSLLSLVLLAAVGGTLAYQVAATGAVKNNFVPAVVHTDIEEDDSLGNKTVRIQNNGESPAYVRARLMVSGVAQSQLVLVSKLPDTLEADKVYLEIAPQGAWAQTAPAMDGFWYYCNTLPVGQSTQPLMTKVAVGSGLYAQMGLEAFLKTFDITIYQESLLAVPEGLTQAGEIEAVFTDHAA